MKMSKTIQCNKCGKPKKICSCENNGGLLLVGFLGMLVSGLLTALSEYGSVSWFVFVITFGLMFAITYFYLK